MDDRPQLRPVEAVPFDSGGERLVCLRDPSGLSPKTVVLPSRAFLVAALCDGQHTLREIQEEYVRRFGDLLLIEKVEEMVRQLDEALLLEGERFEGRRRAAVEAFARAGTRPAAFAGGSYPARPSELRPFLDRCFNGEGGPGRVDPVRRGSAVAAVVAPHIDPRRGGATFARAYKELAERCAAETFVVLGIAHLPMRAPFVLTEKDFETPLGTVPCDREAVRALMAGAGTAPAEEEFLHRGEHSIEFQALFLRHVFGASRPARIVPVLCGPLAEGPDPLSAEPAARFLAALRGLLRERAGKAAVIASADLSHVGRRFGDADGVTPEKLAEIAAADRALLRRAEEMDAAGFIAHNRSENDRRRVCGVPALAALLAAVPARRGRVVHYAQSPEPETESVVTFAAMSFEHA